MQAGLVRGVGMRRLLQRRVIALVAVDCLVARHELDGLVAAAASMECCRVWHLMADLLELTLE